MSTYSSTNGSGNGAAQAVAWQPESPFLPVQSHELGAITTSATAPATAFGTRTTESPFRAEFDGEGTGFGPQAEQLASLMSELYDSEFEEALVDLVDDGAAVVAAREERESDDPARDRELSERMLREYYAPLVREAYSMLDRMSAEMGEADLATLSEDELDERLAAFAPPPMPGASEAFEQFLGKLLNKAKKGLKVVAKAAKKVASTVGRLVPINLVLGRLRGFVGPMVERVLRFALDRLPAALRPVAAQLAQKMFGVGVKPATPAPVAVRTLDTPPADAASVPTTGEPGASGTADAADAAAPDPAEIQQEFDTLFAGSLVAGEAFETEVAMQELLVPIPRGGGNALRELRHARRRFARRVVRLRRNEDPTPEVENFLPAVLMAARMGVKLIGRPKVVNFLANLVSKLIAKYVGPQPAAALSRALVDSGLRLVSLEVSEEEESLAAGYTLASTVENTINHLLAAAPERAWQDETLLESYALEAFERAAVAAFPDSLIRAELHEGATTSGAWVTVPALAAYEKLSAMPQVTITPQQARDVRTFGGDSLASVLRSRYGLPADRTVTARMHLYRALPGTTLSGIALRERVRGLGSARRESWTLLHPLTPDAARVLLGEPGLGFEVEPTFLVRREVIRPLQRFYYLELRDADARIATAGGRPPRTSQVRVSLDFPAGTLEVHVYYAEPEAQELAARLRGGDGMRTLPLHVRPALQRRLRKILTGQPTDRVRVVHEAVAPQGGMPAPLARVLGAAGERLVDLLVEWMVTALRTEVEQRADGLRTALVSAADAPDDGITLSLRVSQPAFLPTLRRLLAASAAPSAADVAALVAAHGFGAARVDVRPGFVA